ncbi:MAG: large conductance mechanosensitive channel protein MscL [Lachnospiraceae bacterium]|nr:large conductance mechanosensitive channel protein MscL [Lachnospiraceae bacterium]
MMKILKEFKEFISRGNVMDMAVGIIIGGAFTSIVNSLVNDIINPLIGMIGGTDLTGYVLVLKDEATLNYGSFLTAIINFLIMAIVVFAMIKIINTMSKAFTRKKKEEPAAPTTKVCPFCKSEVNIEATRCPHCTSELSE